MLSSDEWILIVITLSALALILTNRLPPDVVGVLVLLALGFSRVVSPEQALSGFSSPVVMTLLGLFVITHALEETGLVAQMAERLNRLGAGSEARLVMVFMAAGATLSLVMNNIAAGAVLLPVAVRVGRISAVNPSRLLIPLSFGTLAGGMATYLTTANIVLSAVLQDQGQRGLSMRDFIPTGGLILLACLLYMLLIGRRWLPNRPTITESLAAPDLHATYQLDERLWEVQIRWSSPLVGKALKDSEIGEKLGLSVIALWRGHEAILSPEPDQIIQARDYLLVMGREERVAEMVEWGVTFRGENYDPGSTHRYNVELSEVVIPPRSNAIGHSLTDIRFRNKYGLTATALWREGRSYRTDVGKFPLQVGDALLMIGPPAKIHQLNEERDFLVLNQPPLEHPRKPHKAGWAALITAAVLIIAVLDMLPLAEIMLAGMMALVITGCLSMEDAYRAVEWRVIFLIAGMLPLSIAMSETGLAERIGEGLQTGLTGLPPLMIIAALFAVTVGITQVLGGQVTALILGPIAVSVALQAGISPQAVAVAVSIGCSTAFLTPIAHPVNILMMGPGGYRAGDFFRVGLGMTITVFLALLPGLILFWGV